MSNLFKQYNTVVPEQNVRIMDYNSMIEQKLAKLKRLQNAGNTDGFQNLGEISEDVEEEDPNEILQAAKTEAEELLQNAKKESERLLSEAAEKSKEVLIQAKEEGHKEGYEAAFSQTQGELEEEYRQKRAELEQTRQKLHDDYQKEMQELEPKLLDVILSVVEKVFHIQFEDKRDILLYLVGNTIADIEGTKSFRIRVGDEQKLFLENRRNEILDRIGHDMSLEIVSDGGLTGNQCIIETDTGIFDCSMDVQLKNLIKDLRSLSS